MFENRGALVVTTIANELSPDVNDGDIVPYAATHDSERLQRAEME